MQSRLEQFAALGGQVIAASADPEHETRELVNKLGLTFPIGFGVSRELADAIGAWWDPGRGIIQPAEFVVDVNGRILSSTYSSGPIGRAEPADILSLLGIFEKRRAAGA